MLRVRTREEDKDIKDLSEISSVEGGGIKGKSQILKTLKIEKWAVERAEKTGEGVSSLCLSSYSCWYTVYLRQI